MSATRTANAPIVEESAIAHRVFAETGPAAIVWLVVRLYLGYEWLVAGWDKVTSDAWMDGGAALQGFAAGAIERGTQGDHPAVAYGWYVNFLEVIRDSAHTWMAPLVAVGEVVIGIALLVGAFVGIAAFFGVVLNFSFIFAGSAGVNPLFLVIGLLLMLAWRNAGWFGLDRWVLPAVGTPFRGRHPRPAAATTGPTPATPVGGAPTGAPPSGMLSDVVIGGVTLTSRAVATLSDELERAAATEPLAAHRDLLRLPDLANEPGWRRVQHVVEVGDGDFAAARDHVLSFEVLRHVGIGVHADHDRAVVGATVVQRVPRRGPGALAPCRVVDVVDATDEVGFLYAALPGHPVAGEEAFHVHRRDDGMVVCRVTSRSRPDAAAARLLAPLLATFQRVAAGRYVAGMAEAARG